jgi:putative glycosyltransferase (TIGR04348 family)
MKIGIVTPAPPKSRYGNRVTALRYAQILRSLGHSVSVKQQYEGEPWDLLVALHARRSHASIKKFHHLHPSSPIVVTLTGTDLYRDLAFSRSARESVELASRIVVLQPKALEVLRPSLRTKARVVFQSVTPFVPPSSNRSRLKVHSRSFDVCVIGHLRPVKDPFRAAMASRLLPASSKIRIIQVGSAMTSSTEARALEEMKKNSRYRWLGQQPRSRVLSVLRQSRLCVLSSRMEGGANALGESIVAGTPVLASRIPGSIGMLGESYNGYFEVGDTRKLASLMLQAEKNASFLSELREHCRKLVSLFDPAVEAAKWKALLDELS